MTACLVAEQLNVLVVLNGIFEQIHHVAVICYRHRFFALHGLMRPFKGFGYRLRNFLHPSLAATCLDTRSIHFGYDGSSAGNFGCFGLSAAHAAKTRGHKEMTFQIAVGRNTEFHTSGVEQGVESAVNDALRTDIHPSAGCHLTVIGHTKLHSLVPVMLGVEHTHHHGVGDDDAGSLFRRGKKT